MLLLLLLLLFAFSSIEGSVQLWQPLYVLLAVLEELAFVMGASVVLFDAARLSDVSRLVAKEVTATSPLTSPRVALSPAALTTRGLLGRLAMAPLSLVSERVPAKEPLDESMVAGEWLDAGREATFRREFAVP